MGYWLPDRREPCGLNPSAIKDGLISEGIRVRKKSSLSPSPVSTKVRDIDLEERSEMEDCLK